MELLKLLSFLHPSALQCDAIDSNHAHHARHSRRATTTTTTTTTTSEEQPTSSTPSEPHHHHVIITIVNCALAIDCPVLINCLCCFLLLLADATCRCLRHSLKGCFNNKRKHVCCAAGAASAGQISVSQLRFKHSILGSRTVGVLQMFWKMENNKKQKFLRESRITL
jgi:hypothetical protein